MRKCQPKADRPSAGENADYAESCYVFHVFIFFAPNTEMRNEVDRLLPLPSPDSEALAKESAF
jgi:hypothetical protein